MLEKEVEKKICDYAKRQGWDVFKFESPSNMGVPDRIFFRLGVTMLLEVKRPGESPTKLQLKRIRDFRRQRIYAWWTDNANDIKYYLRNLDTRPANVDFSLDEHALKA